MRPFPSPLPALRGEVDAPIIGQAWVAYVPNGRVVGISKLARVVEVFVKRLQIQEKMTAQIANTSDLVTSRRMLGCFRDNPATRQEFLSMAVKLAE